MLIILTFSLQYLLKKTGIAAPSFSGKSQDQKKKEKFVPFDQINLLEFDRFLSYLQEKATMETE